MTDIMNFAYSIELPVYDGFTKFLMWPSEIKVISPNHYTFHI